MRGIQNVLDSLTNAYFGQLGLKGIVAFTLASRKQMYILNSTYRSKFKSTDILAFPSASTRLEHQSALKEQFLNAKIRGKAWPIQFGHLVICPAVLERKLRAIKSKRVREFNLKKMIVHGFAHLANLDHHTLAEYKIMRSFEGRLLRAISK